jgi:hypothetical protein
LLILLYSSSDVQSSAGSWRANSPAIDRHVATSTVEVRACCCC